MIEMVEGITNFGTGQTELVLSTIYWIFTNMMKDNLKSCSKALKTKYAERLINQSIKILEETLKREFHDETDEDEESEKYILALSIMNFFKFISEEDETRRHLQVHYKKLKPLLIYEQAQVFGTKFL